MDQRPIKKTILLIIRLAVMAGFYFLAVHYSVLTRNAAQIITISLDGEGLPAESARKIAEAQEIYQAQGAAGGQGIGQTQGAAGGQDGGQVQGPEEQNPGANSSAQLRDSGVTTFCLWTEQPEAVFSCRETGRQIQAAALFTEGNPELAAQGSELLLWAEGGCFVDTATADELFGTRAVNGQLIWFGENAYTVYGTFESLRRTVVLRGDAGTGISFDMVSLRVQDGESVQTCAEQFLMQCGLSGEIMDFSFPGALSGDFLLLLPLLLAASLIRILWRSESLVLPVRAAGIGLACAAVYFMLRNYLEIPADMIPTRWSDFSFWSAWWQDQRANLLRILGSAQGEMQLAMLWNFGLSVICNVIAVSFYCITPENTL